MGWPHDKVLRYAEPLLAERAYIAEQAQSVEVRRSGGGATLLDTACEALGVDPQSGQVAWDARRRDDGKWVVTARYADRGRPQVAEWTYDHAGRNLHPVNDQARALMGVRTVAADEVDPISDALDLIAEHPTEIVEARPRLVAVPDAEDEQPPAEIVEAEEEPAATATTVTIPHPSSPAPQPTAAPAAGPAATAKPPAKAKGRKRRASVPSWDEILFGATKPDDE